MKYSLSVLTSLALVCALTPSAVAQKCGEIPSVLVIQDRSGSMKELVAGKSKWEIAKGALSNIATQYGGQLSMGLMLYPLWPDTTACAPGTMNVAPALNNKVALITALNKVYPNGNTPLTTTLDATADMLAKSKTTVHHVIVITDGVETCLSPAEPLTKAGSCQWNSGTNYRKCGGCGWQFCLGSGVWSTTCAPVPGLHPCAPGQTCGKDALCTGSTTGATTGPAAMAKLAKAGITGHVIGFGAAVDPGTLKAMAVAGGTQNFSHATNPAGLQAALAKIVAGINCCGNGALDPGEACDPKIAAGTSGACPTAASCSDGKACTADSVTGTDCSVTCKHTAITQAASGDGCCPPGADSGTDADCPPSCGNGVLDAGEKCDPKIPKGQKGACDLVCDDGDSCTRDIVGGSACNPSCTALPLTATPKVKDNCCPKSPANLTNTQDPDCPPPCSPTQKTGCVDLCKGKVCQTGFYCKYGKCVPFPEADTGAPKSADGGGGPNSGADTGTNGGSGNPGNGPNGGDGEEGGCDCRVSGAEGHLGSLVLLVALLRAARRRRRR